MTDEELDEKWHRLAHEVRQRSRGKAEWLAMRIRRMIIQGEELRHGDVLPSEAQLKRLGIETWVSKPAYAKLRAGGLARGSQGQLTQVHMPGEKRYRLIVSRFVDQLEESADQEVRQVADFPQRMELVPVDGSPLDAPRWQDGLYTVPAWDSPLLGIDPGVQAHTHSMIVSAGGKPIGASISLVVPELLGDTVRWSDAEIGQLALTGVSVRFSEQTRVRERPPTLVEEELLGITSAATRVQALYRPCRVRVPNSTLRGPGCVLVVVNDDLVDPFT